MTFLSKHPCPWQDCDSQFFDAQLLASHLDSVHGGPPQGPAETEPTPTDVHPMTTAGEGTGEEQGPLAPPFPTPERDLHRKAAPEHQREETPVVETTFHCHQCGRTFKHAKRLQNHMEAQHKGTEEGRGEGPGTPVAKATPAKRPAAPHRPKAQVVDGDWCLFVEVEPGITVQLHAPSEPAFLLACRMADRYEIPYTVR